MVFTVEKENMPRARSFKSKQMHSTLDFQKLPLHATLFDCDR